MLPLRVAASRRAVPFALVAVMIWACLPAEEIAEPQPESGRPQVRVALVLGADSVSIGGGQALLVHDGDGVLRLEVPEQVTVAGSAATGGALLRLDGGLSIEPAHLLRVSPRDEGGLVRLNGRDYRGELLLLPVGRALTVVNRLDIEGYLAGVISAEMGRRGAAEQAALEAQAVVSRTFALRALLRFRERPYDLVATVADQAYQGVAAELPQGWQAIAATAGQVLSWEGQPIEAFFHSTCGGRTAAGEEVFVDGARPYLRSTPDLAPDGTAWCAISPRYRWTERWASADLHEVLRRTLPALGVEPGRIGTLADIRVGGQTPSGRVRALLLRFDGGAVPIEGSAAVRQALQPVGGALLRSAAFRLEVSRSGDRLREVRAEGSGAGHGVGFCQWGAVGRARGGADWRAILHAYFLGADVERRW